ncbi:MAG: YlbF family regulator [Eubacteriales bacterium]|nr:YlbF family regulator [Eubacteriales bacterium]
MNETILQKARELGEELKNSDVFKKMTEQEEKANTNPALVALSSEYEQLRISFQEKSLEDTPNKDELNEIGHKMEELKTKIMSHSDMQKLSEYRQEFNTLMESVNMALQSELLPPSACQGNCAGCSGC